MRILLALTLALLSFNIYAVTAIYSWDGNLLSTYYECEYSINAAAFQPCSASTIGPTHTETFTGLLNGDTVTMHARACVSDGCSGYGAEVTGTYLDAPVGGILILVSP